MKQTEKQKTYVIGDVHGCFHTLQQLIAQLPNDAKLIFVGDLCDRGLYTKEVLSFIIQNKHTAILGNHDNYMIKHALESLDGHDNRWYKKDYMGGKATLKSYEHDLPLLKEHIAWLKTLPKYLLVDDYFISHGFGLPYFQRKDEKSGFEGLIKNRVEDEQEWGYDWESDWQSYGVINIFGHTDYENVKINQHYYAIDTGCVYGRKLTALELGSMKLFEQPCDRRDINS